MIMRQNVMLCCKYTEKRLKKWGFPVIMQCKLNGLRCRATFTQGAQLYSSEANRNCSVPHIITALDKLGLSSTHLDGELYRHGMSLQQIRGFAGANRKVLKPGFEQIEYHIFDIIKQNSPQVQRIELLSKLAEEFDPASPLKMVPTFPIYNWAEFYSVMDEILGKGYEGIIVRHPTAGYVFGRSNYIMKLKPRQKMTVTIEACTEALTVDTRAPKGELGAFVCRTPNKTIVNVGTGFTHADRIFYWDEWKTNPDSLVGVQVNILFQELSDDKVPLNPVFVEVVDE